MLKFSESVIRYRKIIISITIAITLGLGYFLKDLKVESDVSKYLPKSDPTVKLFNYIGEEYGGNSLVMIVLEAEEIFTKETLKSISYLTSQFKLVDGVSYVTSLTNVPDIKKIVDGIEIGRLIDEYNLPATSEDLQKIKNYTLSKDMYRGFIVSTDSKAALIICRLRTEFDKMKTVKQLKEIVNKSGIKEKVYYGGIPFQMIEFNNIILDESKLLVPLSIVLISISLFLSFRTVSGVLIPILSVLISTIWTLGLMGIFKIAITVISNSIPVILIAVGGAYSIHVISKFNEVAPTDKDKIRKSADALSRIILPVMLAAITTIAGFISFVFGSYLILIREFGIFSSIGILFSLIISVTFVPSVLSLLHTKQKRGAGNEVIAREKGFDIFMGKLAKWILKNEKIIIYIGVIIVIASILCIPKITRRVNMLDYFKPGTNIRQTEELMKQKLGGSTPLQILVNGDIFDPAVLNEMKKMTEFLESQVDLHNVQSVVDLIEEMSDVMGEGKVIPDRKDKVANLWFLLEGEEIINHLVNPDKTEAIIHATFANADTKQIQSLVENIETYIKKANSDSVTFAQTGMPSIYIHLDNSIFSSQIKSLILAIILVFICLVFLVRSFFGGLIGLIPIGFSLVVIFGLMGITGIPLDIATVLVGSICIGIGIDYSIHFINRFREEFKKDKNESEALKTTLETTGKAILINVIAVTIGFLVFFWGNVVPMQRFGILVAITMICAGIGSIIILPAVILLTKARFIGDFQRFLDKSKNYIVNKINNKGGIK